MINVMMMDNGNKKVLASSTTNEMLYSKTLLVRLTNSRSEEKYKHISITVDYQTTTQPTHKTELIIKLTDDQDPFFLYSLYMSEEDYQILKCQQGLLVDFGAFGQKFVDLLNLCEKDEKTESPKFQLQFFTKEPLPFDHNNANLNVIEINPFKHLCHLQLNFMPGNDTDVKKYLANCLQTLKENYTRLCKEYAENKTSLTQRLETTQQMLTNKNTEFEKLKLEIDTQSERLNTRYMQELNFEKEKSMQTQYTAQQKYDKEKKDLEGNFNKLLKSMETRLGELETANKDLLDKKYKNESQIQELRSKYTAIQDEYNQMKQDLMHIRKQNTTLDTELHTNEKTLNHLRTRIAVLEQEVKDKDELVQRTHELLNNEQSQKKAQDELLNERNQEIKKLQASVKQVSQELNKGNEIIGKLQAKLRTFNSKMKLKNDILTQQERVLCEKDKELATIKNEFKDLQENMLKNGEENKELRASVNKKTLELEEAAKLLKKDEHMINWLNKQLTELNVNGNANNPMLNGGTPGQVMLQFKPFGALSNGTSSVQQQATITPRNMTTTSNNTEQISQNCLSSNSSNSSSSASSSVGIMRSNSATRNFNGSTGNNSECNLLIEQQPRPYTVTSALNQNGTVNTITTSAQPTTTVTRTLNATQQSTRSLDPKYFQPTSPIDPLNTNGLKARLNATTNGMTQSVVPPTIMNQQQQLVFGQQQQTGTRINKQLVNQMPTMQAGITAGMAMQNNFLPCKSTPALASAYFPTN